MKTFQTAIATSLHFLKLPILLLAIFFNFSIGEPLPIPIGGHSVPRHFAQSHVGIGENESSPIEPIGGTGGTAIRKYAINDFEIGGHGGTQTRKLLDIGGNGGSTAPRNILHTVSFETASINLPKGNQGVARQLKEIGGSQTPSRSNSDIGGGGNETRRLLMPLPIVLNIGGMGGGQVPPRAYIAATSLSTASKDISIGGQEISRRLSVIGGQEAARHFVEIGDTNGTERRNIVIGGSQTVPRSLTEIGGEQLSPREIGGNSCPRC